MLQGVFVAFICFALSFGPVDFPPYNLQRPFFRAVFLQASPLFVLAPHRFCSIFTSPNLISWGIVSPTGGGLLAFKLFIYLFQYMFTILAHLLQGMTPLMLSFYFLPSGSYATETPQAVPY